MKLKNVTLLCLIMLLAWLICGCAVSAATTTPQEEVAATTTESADTQTNASAGMDATAIESSIGEGGPPEMPNGEPPKMPPDGGPPGMPDGGATDSGGTEINKTAVYEQDGGSVSESGKTYAATQTDESAVYVYGAGSYTLSDATLTKTGDSSSESSSNFYGNNAIVLAEGESTITLTDCTLIADSDGSNGAFAYGEGASIVLDDCTISTSANSSRGVDATYGGSVTITNSEIHTSGDHSAALATDRYENNNPPTISADNVNGTTSGEGSPGIYSTGTFDVFNSTFAASGSEAAAIEGFNSIKLSDSDISGSVKWGVLIYQSTSGDASVGVGTFDMTGGSLTNNSSGPVFMICNTEAIIYLQDVDIDTSGNVILRATDAASGDEYINSDWGSAGGEVTVTAVDQTLEGSISINALSSLDLTLSGTSSLTGAVEIEDGGEVKITLEDNAIWNAADTSYVTTLDGVVFSGNTPMNVDAASGVVVYYSSATNIAGTALIADYTLPSGGRLVKN